MRTTNISNKPPLGKIIAVRLCELGATQLWLANEVQITHIHLNGIIAGTRKPSVHLLKRIAKCLDLDIKDLANAFAAALLGEK